MKVTLPEKGFSLIELVVYIGLFSLVILFLFQFIFNLLSVNTQSKAFEALINNSLQTLNAIDAEIRNASALYEPTSTFGSADSQLSLVVPNDSDSGPSELYSDIYISEDDRVCIKRDTSGVSCVSSEEIEVVSLTFNKIAPEGGKHGAQVILVMQNKTNNSEDRVLFTLQSSAQVRAY